MPVVGTHPVTGRLVVKNGRVASAAMYLAFGIGGALTELPIRDHRLQELIFGAAKKWPFTFHLTTVEGIGGLAVAKLPDAGMTVQMTSNGTLSIAGVGIPVDVPVLVTATGKGLRVNEGLNGIHLDLKEKLGLGPALEALLALVPGVTLGDDLQLRMALDVLEACQN